MFSNTMIQRDFYWRLMALFCISALIIICSDSAFATAASGSNSNDVIGNTLCRITDILTGKIAKGIATIAIFVIGVGLFTGKVNWSTASMTAIGVGIIFGAGKIVSLISGTEGNSAACGTSS